MISDKLLLDRGVKTKFGLELGRIIEVEWPGGSDGSIFDEEFKNFD